jgi:hypothetical protein
MVLVTKSCLRNRDISANQERGGYAAATYSILL